MAARGSHFPADLTFYSAWVKRKVTGWRGGGEQASKALQHHCAPAHNLFIENKCLPLGHLDFLFMVLCIFRVLHHERTLRWITLPLSSQSLSPVSRISALYCFSQEDSQVIVTFQQNDKCDVKKPSRWHLFCLISKAQKFAMNNEKTLAAF